MDFELLDEVKDIKVIKTNTKESLKIYSQIFRINQTKGFPKDQFPKRVVFQNVLLLFVAISLFPMPEKVGMPMPKWKRKSSSVSKEFKKVITTGPPHSTHLVGLQLKAQFGIKWWVDFRDPLTDIFYNKDLYCTAWAKRKDARLGRKSVTNCRRYFDYCWGKFCLQTPNQSTRPKHLYIT